MNYYCFNTVGLFDFIQAQTKRFCNTICRQFFSDQTIIQAEQPATMTTPSISNTSITKVFFKSLKATSATALNNKPPKILSVLKKGIIIDQNFENTQWHSAQWVNWRHLMVDCIFRYKNKNLTNNLGNAYYFITQFYDTGFRGEGVGW